MSDVQTLPPEPGVGGRVLCRAGGEAGRTWEEICWGSGTGGWTVLKSCLSVDMEIVLVPINLCSLERRAVTTSQYPPLPSHHTQPSGIATLF